MIKQLLFVWVIVAAALAVAAWLVPSVEFEGGFFALLGVAAVFGLVNAVIGPLLHLVSLPLTAVTFGLFSLVINGVLLAITAGLTDALDVGGFVPTMIAAVVISVISAGMAWAADRLFARPSAAV